MRATRRLRLAVGLWLVGLAMTAQAEPYLAVQQGYECQACHVNATGGGLRSDFGTIFAQNVMAARTLPAPLRAWSGGLGDHLRVGADLRTAWTRTDVPNAPGVRSSGLEQLRVYGDIAVIPRYVDAYIDEVLAPGNNQLLEGYVRIAEPTTGLYVKAGQFYLPFGWRLQDQSAFVREVSGISMTTPDNGVELGVERGAWSAQVDLSDGVANAGAHSGNQVTGQVVWVHSRYRVGAAAALTSSRAGDRRVAGLFGGVRVGPVALLGEADLVRDEGFPGGERKLVATLVEADWALRRGHNLKLTAESFDPDRAVANDQKARWSVLYEWTPIPFVQLRGGLRRYAGIPQNDLDNRRAWFVELHAWL